VLAWECSKTEKPVQKESEPERLEELGFGRRRKLLLVLPGS
jgi:hypothetical protein